MATARDTRNQIIDAAECLFGSKGYGSVSINQICEESGFPVGSVYHHFGSKAGVLRAVLERGSTEFFANLPKVDDSVGSPEERLAVYYERAADLITKQRQLFRLFTSLRLHEAGNRETQEIVDVMEQRAAAHMTAYLEPIARGYGVPDPAACARELTTITMIYTSGAVSNAGDDEDRIRAEVDTLHRLVQAAILQRTTRSPVPN
ncbi:TetR/AcrR family transcriptional regulator [Streptomyces aquilus]|uniref:TetR/AcrR family transcriptional regulator n=1 Tax=Streptomyces aquilus TaxID=2548456 RepID=UPI0036B19C6B